MVHIEVVLCVGQCGTSGDCTLRCTHLYGALTVCCNTNNQPHGRGLTLVLFKLQLRTPYLEDCLIPTYYLDPMCSSVCVCVCVTSVLGACVWLHYDKLVTHTSVASLSVTHSNHATKHNESVINTCPCSPSGRRSRSWTGRGMNSRATGAPPAPPTNTNNTMEKPAIAPRPTPPARPTQVSRKAE